MCKCHQNADDLGCGPSRGSWSDVLDKEERVHLGAGAGYFLFIVGMISLQSKGGTPKTCEETVFALGSSLKLKLKLQERKYKETLSRGFWFPPALSWHRSQEGFQPGKTLVGRQ